MHNICNSVIWTSIIQDLKKMEEMFDPWWHGASICKCLLTYISNEWAYYSDLDSDNLIDPKEGN